MAITLCTQAELVENYQIVAVHTTRRGRIIVVAWQTKVRGARLNANGEVYDKLWMDTPVPDHYRDGAWWEGDYSVKVKRNDGGSWVDSPWVQFLDAPYSQGVLKELASGTLELFLPGARRTTPPPTGMSPQPYIRWWCKSLKDDGVGTWEPQN